MRQTAHVRFGRQETAPAVGLRVRAARRLIRPRWFCKTIAGGPTGGAHRMSWITLVGYAASSAVLATFCMKTMRPLRIVALGSNVLFATYAFFGGLYPVLILHLVLFPINLARLVQLQNLTRRVAAAATGELS